MDDQAVPVVSYARISADTARDEHGVADQHKVNRETAARLGWTVVHEITDNDRSASKLNVVREGFEQLLRILRSGHLPDGTSARGVVVVADDRLARRSGDYERFVDALTHQEGRVYADARGRKDLYSEDVEGMGLIGVAFAKIETRKISSHLDARRFPQATSRYSVGSSRVEYVSSTSPVSASIVAESPTRRIGAVQPPAPSTICRHRSKPGCVAFSASWLTHLGGDSLLKSTLLMQPQWTHRNR